MNTVTDTELRPDGRTVLRWLGLVLAVSLLVGGFLFHLFYGLDRIGARWTDFWANVYYSFVYTAVMSASIMGADRALRSRMSLRSRRAIALHVGALSVVAVLSYGLATGICEWSNPSGFNMEWEIMLTTGTVAFLVTIVWSTIMYTAAFYRQLRKSEAARYEARLEALRAQINPHFLFNAFNSIAALIRTRPEEAETVVEDLSDLFRYTLEASKNEVSTLGEEIEAARRYLAIEEARFRDRLTVEVEVPESLEPVSVPSMTVQPLAENAVKHGVCETQEPCTVWIEARRENDTLLLRVTDTGPGFEETDLDAVTGEGTGLANVRERLRLFYGKKARMRLLPQGVELRLPGEPDPDPAIRPNDLPDRN